jgi:DNA-binding transcriptional regulator YdaS (Cro superfamily)
MDDSLKRAVEQAGGPTRVASLFGISSQAVSQWDRCPAQRVLKLAEASGVAPHELRPDLYPQPRRRAAQHATA